MKKIILTLIVILSAISTNAQKVEKLEGRLVPEPSCFEKIIDFFKYDIPDVFKPFWETWGLGYTCSKFFPIEVSANITRWEYFSLGLGVGINTDAQKYQIKNYNPKYYMMISPGVYLRFISINCGVGILSSAYKMTTSDTIYIGGENNGDGFIDGTIHNEIPITTSDCHFIVKPSITGYIPICDEEYYITINAGYNYIPKFKELNGWSFGVGFQWLIW